MKYRIVYLTLLMASVSFSAARPPQRMSPSGRNTSVLQARLKGLEARGATEVMPVEQYRAVDRAIAFVVDGASLAHATKTLDDFEAAFDERASQEANSARDACIRLEWQVAQVEETIDGGAGCDGLPDAVADLEDQLSELRSLAYTIGGNVYVSIQVRRLVTNVGSAMNDVVVDAAVCGIVRVNADNAGQMLEAAGRMARTQLAYGSAVRLYSGIVEGAPGTEAAAAALSRIDGFGPDLQQKLAATVRSATAACDAEVARLNLKELEGLMAALSERTAGLVDPSVRWEMPELNRLVRLMDEECPPDRVVHRPAPGHALAPVSNEVIEIEDLIRKAQFDTAGVRIAGLASAEEKTRLETLLDANVNMVKAESVLRAGDLDEAIVLAEKAWQGDLRGRAGRVLAECLSARAEVNLSKRRPEPALVDVQRALIAAPESGRAQRAAATAYQRLGEQALASGNADEALRLFRESTLLRESGELRLEMARLLVAGQQLQEARLEAEHAERLGVSIDAATRLQVFALSFLMSGEIEAAWHEINKVAEKNAWAVDDLKIHLLRLPLSASAGRLAAGLANAGGLMRRGTGVLAFVGSDTSAIKGSLKPVRAELSGPGLSGFSDDYRYMFFSDSKSNIVIFDARAGKAAERADGELAKGRVRSLAALARVEVVEALTWFLVTPLEDALNSDMGRADKNEAVLSALADMVTAGLDYALLADPRGKATHVAGSIGESYETGLMVGVVSTPNTRSVTVGGASYREVVAPVRIGGSVQAMLVLGVAVGEAEKP